MTIDAILLGASLGLPGQHVPRIRAYSSLVSSLRYGHLPSLPVLIGHRSFSRHTRHR